MDFSSLILLTILVLIAALWVGHLFSNNLSRLQLLQKNSLCALSWPLMLCISGLSILLFITTSQGSLIVRAPSLPIASDAPFWFALYFDRLSTLMLAFISFVGALVYRFSIRYLDGEPRQEQFLAKLIAATSSAQLLVVSGTLPLFAISWLLIGLNLHNLLEHYHTRPRALLAARKKFIISRIGDLSLLIAAALVWNVFETVDFATIYEMAYLNNIAATERPYLQLATLAILVAAMCKSAQFPFHSWLPDTLETPTPVSALMHAGIVSGGGYAIIRLSPLFNLTPSILTLAVIIGATTSILGLVVMWSQTTVKKRLAWSTVSQMGFMVLECGLGAYNIALIHIVGHGLYKVHAFLNSGATEEFKQPTVKPRSFSTSLLDLTVGLVIACLLLAIVTPLSGHSLASWPGGMLALIIFALSLSQLFVQHNDRTVASYTISITITGAMIALAVMAENFTDLTIQSIAAPPLEARGLLGMATFLTVATAFVATISLSLLFRSERHRDRLESLYAHAVNGFYFGLYADRLTRHLWPKHRQRKRAISSPSWIRIYE